MADNTTGQEWPNERLRVLIPTWTLLIISNVFVVWRVIYGLMKARRFMLSDYLLILAAVCSQKHLRSPILIISDAQHCCILDKSHRGGFWAWETHYGSICAAYPAKICLLPMDIADRQHHRSCVPQVVGLCMASSTRFLQNLSGHRVAFDPYGHGSGILSARFDVIRMYTAASQLGLPIPTEKMLGGGKPTTIVHARHIEHYH